jgi:hypothetical protein
MRTDCKHYQSRTYSDGEVASFCELDLAPEAPWKCPDDCSSYERRLVDTTFERGTLIEVPEEEPEEFEESTPLVLDEAEEIVTAAIPEIAEEVEGRNTGASEELMGERWKSDSELPPRKRRSWWQRFNGR